MVNSRTSGNSVVGFHCHGLGLIPGVETEDLQLATKKKNWEETNKINLILKIKIRIDSKDKDTSFNLKTHEKIFKG